MLDEKPIGWVEDNAVCLPVCRWKGDSWGWMNVLEDPLVVHHTTSRYKSHDPSRLVPKHLTHDTPTLSRRPASAFLCVPYAQANHDHPWAHAPPISKAMQFNLILGPLPQPTCRISVKKSYETDKMAHGE